MSISDLLGFMSSLLNEIESLLTFLDPFPLFSTSFRYSSIDLRRFMSAGWISELMERNLEIPE